MNIEIRETVEPDYRATEIITRDAFWNLYVPGCDEHYLLHILREHEDFIGDLDYVALVDGEIVGNIVYTKSCLVSDDGRSIDTLTFGPISVKPEYQRKGIGSLLIRKTLGLVEKRGIPAVPIYGHPYNYVKHGFVSGRRFNIGIGGNRYPSGLLVYMIDKNRFMGGRWSFVESEAYSINHEDANRFDKTFPGKRKEVVYTQEDFWISAHSFIED